MRASDTHEAYDDKVCRRYNLRFKSTLTGLNQTTTNTYESALLNRRYTQDHLDQASQGFIEASQSPNDTQVGPSRYPMDPQMRTAISNHVDEKILSLSSLQATVESAKAPLWHSRGKSTTLAPIHKLPVEILGYIFTLVQPCCVHHKIIQKRSQISKSQLVDALSMVCSLWRKVALSTRELWSHLDFTINVKHVLFGLLYGRARLWIERARGCPLHLHPHEFHRSGKADTKVIKGLLRPNLQHAASVHIWSNSDSTPFEDFTWELALMQKVCPMIREVSIEYESKTTNFIRLPPRYFSSKDGFYDSVSVLHLHRAGVPRDSCICQKLTDLRLEGLGSACPSLAQLAAILAASPGLRSLALSRLDSETILDFYGNPIPLNDLEVLNIGGLQEKWLSPVLRLLAPGPRPLSMSVTPWPEDCKVLEAFFERSNVTRLFFDHSCSPIWNPLPHYLRPSLQVLAIAHSLEFLTKEQPNIISTSADTLHGLNISSKLRSLHLVASSIKPELLIPAVSAHPLEALWLTDCSIQDHKRGPKPRKGYTGPKNMNEVVDLMPEVIQSITRVTHNYDDDPVCCWDCVDRETYF
ncbi:hypothetical protein FRC12_000719 [Ceratobasidium sp. 428]|nr:hypothetical protein FRC12_000719 [Ceratobasidium sp. 428]